MTEQPLELTVDRVAAGGQGIAHHPDGRIAFVESALPGELVTADVVEEKKQFFRTRTREVLRPVPGRVTPACSAAVDGCGGCDWQHADVDTQRGLRRDIIADALRRIGKLGDVEVDEGPDLPAVGYRTVVRAAVIDGRAGFRLAGSHDIVVPEACLTAHRLVAELIREGDFGSAGEVRLVAGARTGERMAVLSGDRSVPPTLPDDVIVVHVDDGPEAAAIHEEIHGRTLRISAGSFFQCRPDGAEALIDTVTSGLALGAANLDEFTLVDAYAGVGLFGATLGAQAHRVVAVESGLSSAADAEVNLAAAFSGPPAGATSASVGWSVVRDQVERWPGLGADGGKAAVIADPARRGLGSRGVAALVGLDAPVLVLVSCDPAALGRDARLLAAEGYELARVTAIDLFGQTSHIEAVSVFLR